MKALVIGGTGPTGPHIVNGLIQRGYQVTILHRGTHEVDFCGEVEHIHADPHFTETLSEALGHRTFDLIMGTYGRLRYIAEVAKGRTSRFIGIGAGAYLGVMDPKENPAGLSLPIPEDAPLYTDTEANKFLYLVGVSEQAVMRAHNDGYYSATILRYPRWIFGPRCLIPIEWSIMRRILDGRKQIIVPDDGLALQTRGYAENLAHAALLAADKPEARGQIYNTGDDRTYTLREWIEKISSAMAHTWELVGIPWAIAKPSYPYALAKHHAVFDTTKIKTELGYKDAVSTNVAIQKTIEWCLSNREYVNQVEKNLGDKFDYQTEDKIIGEYKQCAGKISSIPFTYERPPHAYPHPKRPQSQ